MKLIRGDKQCNVELGHWVGATTLLVRTGYDAKVAIEGTVRPDYIVDDLQDAAEVIRCLLPAAGGVVKHAVK